MRGPNTRHRKLYLALLLPSFPCLFRLFSCGFSGVSSNDFIRPSVPSILNWYIRRAQWVHQSRYFTVTLFSLSPAKRHLTRLFAVNYPSDDVFFAEKIHTVIYAFLRQNEVLDSYSPTPCCTLDAKYEIRSGDATNERFFRITKQHFRPSVDGPPAKGNLFSQPSASGGGG